MTAASLRLGLRQGRSLIGTWAAFDSAYAVELVCSVGFDWVCVDLQHGIASDALLPSLLRAAELAGVPALVRTRPADTAGIQRALDLGAAGVIAPMVDTAAEAKVVADACRYPPAGTRSWGPLRPLVAGRPARDAVDPVCVVMVETTQALERVDEIAGTAHLDAVFVGPADLSLSSAGRLGADLASAGAQVAAACRRAGIAAGTACGGAEAAAAATAGGFQLLTVDWDVEFLRAGAATALAGARAATAAGT